MDVDDIKGGVCVMGPFYNSPWQIILSSGLVHSVSVYQSELPITRERASVNCGEMGQQLVKIDGDIKNHLVHFLVWTAAISTT